MAIRELSNFKVFDIDGIFKKWNITDEYEQLELLDKLLFPPEGNGYFSYDSTQTLTTLKELYKLQIRIC